MIAYLDNSATTRPTEGVAGAMVQSMRDGYFNPSSLYAPAVEAEKAMRACRELIARSVNAQPDGVFFTSGGTEANNLAILGAAAARRSPFRAVVAASEHPSVLSAFDELRALGHEVDVVPVDRSGQIEWAALDGALAKGPALVSAMQVNNETGAVLDCAREGELEPIGLLPNPWAELRFAARSEGVVHLDDLLLRRVRLGMLLPEGGLALLPRIRRIVQPELGWSDQRWETEEKEYRRIWKTYYSPAPGKP
jgi:hypothetical protein